MDDLYLNIDNWVNFRHAPKFKSFHGCTNIPETFSMFDWVYWRPKDFKATRTTNESPRSILCLADPRSINWVLNEAEFNSRPTLVIAGTDSHLSDYIGDLESNSERFKKIYFEAKNINSELITSFSMGFDATYIRDSGKNNILTAIEYSDVNKKSSSLLCAWGKQWPTLDETIDDRSSAHVFLKKNSKYERRMLDYNEYWQEVAKHYFMLAPAGNGVQAPKLAESWMVKTVPIVIKNPCFVDLYDMGYPMVILDSWDEITDTSLENWLEYYQSINWSEVRYMLTNQYFEKLIH